MESSPELLAVVRSAIASTNGHYPMGLADWPTPKPITAELKPVPEFDSEKLLPPVLRRWCMDEAERMPCPPDFVGTAAVVAIGSIIGARCAIKPKARDSWQIVPNIWGGIVGDPSAKKSPAWGAAMRPLDRMVAEAAEVYAAEMADFETQKMVFEAKREAIEKSIKKAAASGKGDLESIAEDFRLHGEKEPEAPTLRRYKSNDTTVERLGELLQENPAGILVLRDELVGLLASWDREGREGDRAFFLEAWNGNQSFDTDRIGRGHISVPNLCVSIFGGIQPDKLTAYLEQAAHSLSNDGMLQRFQLLVYPDHRKWEWRDSVPDKVARDTALDLFKILGKLDPVLWGASPADESSKFPSFRFSEEGQAAFIEWSTDLHRVRIPMEEDPLIRQHLTKYDKLYPALALIFHLVDCAAKGASGPVSGESAKRAGSWCEYLEAHARRCYGLLKDDGLRAAQALAAKLRRGALEDGFTLRDVRKNQWRNLTTGEAVQSALDWLEGDGWLRIGMPTTPTTGRPTTRYLINPAVKPIGGKPDHEG